MHQKVEPLWAKMEVIWTGNNSLCLCVYGYRSAAGHKFVYNLEYEVKHVCEILICD